MNVKPMRDMTLNEWRDAIHAYALAKGWWSTSRENDKAILDRNFGEMLMLIVTEAAEAMEEWRAGELVTATHYAEDGKPEGIPSELIDIMIRVLDICGAYSIDVGGEMADKHTYNLQRSFRHGGKLA